MNLFNWIELLLAPVVGVVSWFAGTRKRRNEAIVQLQDTIDLLAQKNNDLYEEVVKLRAENADLKATIERNTREIENLKRQIEKK